MSEPEQKKVETIARLLGWKEIIVWPGTEHLVGEHENYSHANSIPNYVENQNTRPQMLAVMTPEQLEALAEKLLSRIVSEISWERLTTRKLSMEIVKKMLLILAIRNKWLKRPKQSNTR